MLMRFSSFGLRTAWLLLAALPFCRLYAAEKIDPLLGPLIAVAPFKLALPPDPAAPNAPPPTCTQNDILAAAPATPAPSTAPDPNALLAQATTLHLQQRLAKKMVATLENYPASVSPNTIVIGGCITRAVKGNTAERMVGFNLGASVLAAHIQVLRKTPTGFTPLREFDVQAKGGNLLPPLGIGGAAANALQAYRRTLAADSDKLAAQIAKQFKKVLASPPPAR